MCIAALGLALAAVHAAPGVSDAQASDMTWREHRAADEEAVPIEPDQLFVRENTKPFRIVRASGVNFKARVLQNSGGGLFTAVLFYAPWDAMCQRIAPAWRKAALALQGEVRMVVVDGENKTSRRLRKKYNIQARRRARARPHSPPYYVTDRGCARRCTPPSSYSAGTRRLHTTTTRPSWDISTAPAS